MRKSGLTGDEAYILSKRGKTTEDLGPLKKEIGLIKEDIDNFPFQLIKSKNEFNSESVDNQDGKSLSDVGAVIDDSNYSVSHKIKCQYGDTVYLSRRISDISDERQFVTVWNICAYDSSDKFLGISTKVAMQSLQIQIMLGLTIGLL